MKVMFHEMGMQHWPHDCYGEGEVTVSILPYVVWCDEVIVCIYYLDKIIFPYFNPPGLPTQL